MRAALVLSTLSDDASIGRWYSPGNLSSYDAPMEIMRSDLLMVGGTRWLRTPSMSTALVTTADWHRRRQLLNSSLICSHTHRRSLCIVDMYLGLDGVTKLKKHHRIFHHLMHQWSDPAGFRARTID